MSLLLATHRSILIGSVSSGNAAVRLWPAMTLPWTTYTKPWTAYA
jgi:hypothetical protein